MIFFLNFYYCLTVIIPRHDKCTSTRLRSRVAIGWASLIIFTAMTVILIYWTIWVPNFA